MGIENFEKDEYNVLSPVNAYDLIGLFYSLIKTKKEFFTR